MDIYAANLMDHYKNPRNHGVLQDADLHRVELNSTCGDQIEVFLSLDGEKITEIGFTGEGCAISQAGASMLFDELIGMTKDEVLAMKLDDVLEIMSVPITARRRKCALMGLLAVQNALLSSRGLKDLSFADLLLD